MSGKQVTRIQDIDKKTGEVLSVTDRVYTKVKETFIMIRTTDSLDWYYPLSKNEKSLVMMLHDWADMDNMRVSLSAWQRDFICEKLCVERRMVSVLLKGLETSDCIVRLSQNDFMVNPSHAFKCSTLKLQKMILEYEGKKAGKGLFITPNTNFENE